MNGYDYIIVGGGTAGCVLASRLSADPSAQVLLVETGPAFGPDDLVRPFPWPGRLDQEVAWRLWTTPQSGLDGRRVRWAGGQVLGGSSRINGSVHIRGHRAVYDQWEEDFAPGWSYNDLLPFFRGSETAIGRDLALRGTVGPLWAAPTVEMDDLSMAFVQAMAQAGHPVTPDISGQHQEGSFWNDLTMIDGRRQSVTDAT